MRRSFFVFAATALAVAAPGHAAAGGCETTGSVREPTVSEEVAQIPGPTGPFRYRSASWRSDCTTGKNAGMHAGFGIAGEDGRILVPAKYPAVYPISSTRALVQVGYGTSAELRYYTYGRGESGRAPYTWAETVEVGPGSFVSYARTSDEHIADVAMWVNGDDTPVVLTSVRKVWPMENVLQADFQLEDGTDVSRFLDLKGQPVSPVLGPVTRWAVVPAAAPDPSASPHVPVEKMDQVVTALGPLDHPLIPSDRLYLPIGPDGRFLPLPEGAIGVVPLVKDSHYKTVHGWIVVFPTAEGVELVPTYGALAEALARAATAKRYTGMQRRTEGMQGSNNFIPNVMLVRSRADGLWRLAEPWNLEQEPKHTLEVTAFADPDVAYAAYVKDRTDFQASLVTAREEQERRAAELEHARREAAWKRIEATGSVCLYAYELERLPVEATNHFLRTCEITEGWVLDHLAPGADPALIARARVKYDAYALERALKEAALDSIVPVTPSSAGADPWAAGLRAATDAMSSSSNAYWSNQNAIYTSNLDAYNSGAQSWCCGTAP